MPVPHNPQRGVRSVSGPLIATFRVARANDQRSRSSEFSAAAGAWTLAPPGEAAGFALDPDNAARLRAPDGRPGDWFGLEPVGGGGDDGFSSTVMPWFGEIHNAQGIGGAVVALSADRRVSLRTYTGRHPREIRVFGADTAVAVGDTVQLYAATR